MVIYINKLSKQRKKKTEYEIILKKLKVYVIR